MVLLTKDIFFYTNLCPFVSVLQSKKALKTQNHHHHCKLNSKHNKINKNKRVCVLYVYL